MNSKKYLAWYALVFQDFKNICKIRQDCCSFIRDVDPLRLLKPRHTYTTKFLYTLLPSESYAPGGKSLQSLMRALVDDCNQLFSVGLEVPWLEFNKHSSYVKFMP